MKIGALQSVKFARLKRRLNLCDWEAVGVLERLWLLTASNAPRGDLGRLTDEDIAAMMDWRRGEPGELVEALVASGWLDTDPEHRLTVHDWHEHAPNFIKGNIAKLGGFASGPKDGPKDTPKDPPKDGPKDTPKDPPKDGPKDTPSRARILPSQAKPSQDRESANADSCPEPERPAAVPMLPDEPTVLVFPTVGAGLGSIREWGLTQTQIDEWQSAYPGCDVLAECRKALVWINAHTNRRKTARGMPAFLVGWLNRAQNQSRAPTSQGYQGKRERDDDYFAKQILSIQPQGSSHEPS